jgi:hypothetical protein
MAEVVRDFIFFSLFAKGTKNLIRLCYLIVFLVFFLPKSAETPQLWPSCLSSVFAINKQPFRLHRASCLLFSSSPFSPPRARAPAATTRRPQVRNHRPAPGLRRRRAPTREVRPTTSLDIFLRFFPSYCAETEHPIPNPSYWAICIFFERLSILGSDLVTSVCMYVLRLLESIFFGKKLCANLLCY